MSQSDRKSLSHTPITKTKQLNGGTRGWNPIAADNKARESEEPVTPPLQEKEQLEQIQHLPDTHLTNLIRKQEEPATPPPQEKEQQQLEQIQSFLNDLTNLNSIEELEIIFDLLDASETKELVAIALFIAYRDGNTSENTNQKWKPDEQKAGFYLTKILGTTAPEDIADNSLFWLSWLTTIRLVLLRSDREFFLDSGADVNYLAVDRTKPWLSFGLLARSFSVLQLSYALELGVCIFDIVYESIRPETEADQINNKSWLDRFEWERFWKLIKRKKWVILNALLWLIVNGICFFWFTTPLGICIWNLGGFLGDIALDSIPKYQQWKNCRNLKNKGIGFGTQKIDKKLTNATHDLLWAFFIALGILVGMATYYIFPLVGCSYPLVAKIIGSSIVCTSAILPSMFRESGRLRKIGRYLNNMLFDKNTPLSKKIYVGFCALFFIAATLFFIHSMVLPITNITIAVFYAPITLFALYLANQSIQYIWPPSWSLAKADPTILKSAIDKVAINNEIQDNPPLHRKVAVNNETQNNSSSHRYATTYKMFQRFKKLDANESLALQRASGLSTKELHRHLRNWERHDENKKEVALKYKDFSDFFKASNRQLPVETPETSRTLSAASELTPQQLSRLSNASG